MSRNGDRPGFDGLAQAVTGWLKEPTAQGLVDAEGHMTKEEVTKFLEQLFNITDPDMVDVVWDEMELIRKKKGEC